MTYHIDKDQNWLYNDSTRIPMVSCHREKYSQGVNICDYVVIHYTASGTLNPAHNTYKQIDTPVSWHLTIDTDGTVYQLLDFRKRAWHAGRSNWTRPSGELTGGLNKWSIGIEMINPGPLTWNNDCNAWETWYGKQVLNPSDIYIDETGAGWHTYTREQEQALYQIVPELISTYKCVDVLGHEEISPGRKQDPGRAADTIMTNLKNMCIQSA